MNDPSSPEPLTSALISLFRRIGPLHVTRAKHQYNFIIEIQCYLAILSEQLLIQMDQKNYKLEFKGQGGELFSILIVNWILTLITLGIYYPWAKAKVLQYMYANTELEGHPFAFYGTGKEMFIGFIKGIVLIIVWFGLYGFFLSQEMVFVGILVFMVGAVLIIPLALHGTMRYRMSRSSYRGIHFGYRGERDRVFRIYLRDFFLTVITFGIYGSWLEMNLRRYVQSHVRYGSSEFRFDGEGTQWFLLNFKGVLLSVITLYIYSFKWMADRFNYLVENSSWHNKDGEITMKGTATGMKMFELLVINVLIVVFSLGLATAWAHVRTGKFVADNMKLVGDVDLDSVTQTEAEYKDATADELVDLMDLNIFF
jgi:uncharacterized membrane protein YjgN (DUF898 family)